ncbi:hypothetical protein K435DRAFT_917444 [Dendrothele bispora CBS 962.96]|uniref:FAD/NAD(P)-binding domain-containing protein n=1 Tax=Dendrothele bispora (strain CBS 962.96) TaxID=1314807 RepID=A0A4V4HHK1_DENBC|nr:hypothetical protein K435DRAFT_917444 [Dendrothele bispora CBS 962.96]
MPVTEEVSVEYFDVGGSIAGCSTALSLVRRNPDASVLVLDNADASLFKVGTSLSEEIQQVFSYLAPHLPVEELLLQDTSSSSSSETEPNHYHYSRPIFTRSSGNACTWSSPSLQENVADPRDGSGIGWHLDRRGSSKSEKKMVTLRKASFQAIERVDEGRSWAIVAQEDGHSGRGQPQEKLYISRWVVDASGRDAVVANQLGARTVKFDNLTAYYGLFTQVPDALRADPDHRSIIEASEHGWWYTAQTPYNRPYHPSTTYNYSANKFNKYNTSNVRVVIYYTDESDPSARYAKTSSGFLKLLFRGTFHIARLLTKFQYELVTDSSGWVESGSFSNNNRSSSSSNSSNGGGSKRSSRSSTITTAKKNSGPIYQTPAGSTHLTSCCNSRNGSSGDGARWCAVGESAVAIDPLASQGIVTSMKMGSFVGDVIAKELLIQSEKPLLLELETEVEAEDEGADVDTDAAEGEKARMKMDAMPGDPTDKISIIMSKMRYEREKERLECYRQVGGRFQGEFWGKRR